MFKSVGFDIPEVLFGDDSGKQPFVSFNFLFLFLLELLYKFELHR
jgi:hypothetical protein